LNRQLVAEPLPTRQASHFSNFLKQLEPRLAGCSTTANEITRIAMVGLNIYRHGEEVVGLASQISQSLQEQVDAALRLAGGCKNLSLGKRFAYDHWSTMYLSLYTLVDYAAESVGATGGSG
jgi:hypothetical protein